jgi:tRNA nucleotidyltransferase (CCA-adding enzyme)
LPEVDRLFGIPQPETFHPEVDTGVHVLMAMNLAAKSGATPQAVFALLLHDVGKGLTPVSEWPSHVGHEAAGVPIVNSICERLRVPGSFRDVALITCSLHLRLHRLCEMRPGAVMRLIEEAGLLRRPELLPDFLAACEADYRGRLGWEERAYPQADRLRAALAAVLAVQARDLDTVGLEGVQIGARLREARIAAISDSAGPAG